MAEYDIAIIGAGVLGVSTAYWLSTLYDCSVAVVEKETYPAAQASSRNTGVIHRPFYIDPRKKKIFAASAQKSYFLWKKLSEQFALPWNEIGTLVTATSREAENAFDQYREWAKKNGMKDDEIEILGKRDVARLEPEVNCLGAFHSKTDTSVDYGSFSRAVLRLATVNGVQFLSGFAASDFDARDRITFSSKDRDSAKLSCKLLINLAGGESLDIAHTFGLAKEYSDLHFRGEYWVVEEEFGVRVGRNIYAVPKFREFPFLDPHFIVRASGRREIGPNAVLVFGPNAYHGLTKNRREILTKIFERPLAPRYRLFGNRTFLAMAWHEARSSLSKNAMCQRVRDFIPALDASLLTRPGIAGVRSSIVNKNGFVPEVIELYDNRSVHVLNYNSPGATGAPTFSAHLVANLRSKGYLDGFKEKHKQSTFWDYEWASDLDKLEPVH